jgi:stearoyl-CoA desaturase (delta-9 desaturase)
MESHEKPALLWIQAGIFTLSLLLAVIAVPWYGLTEGFHWSAWLGFIVFAGLNGLSITAGYHRLWSHNAYKAHPLLRVSLALFGAATLQNSILIWSSLHRRHHRYVDNDEKDPYSAGRGLWFSHMGWMLRDYPSSHDDFSNAPDLQRDPIVMWQHKYYLPLAITMNIVPPLLLGWLTGDYLANFLLAGVLRLVFSHHTTFFINSLAHFWGKQPYTDTNSARDNGLLALVTYGEGYHNYHHLFQNDYRNGVRWWQFDPTKWLISVASWLGLAKDLQRIPDFKIREALIAMQFKRAEKRLAVVESTEKLRATVELEYQQFLDTLLEWKALKEQWYNRKRQQLTEAKLDLSRKWEKTDVASRLKELEEGLKLQQKRLQQINVQLLAAAAT